MASTKDISGPPIALREVLRAEGLDLSVLAAELPEWPFDGDLRYRQAIGVIRRRMHAARKEWSRREPLLRTESGDIEATVLTRLREQARRRKEGPWQ